MNDQSFWDSTPTRRGAFESVEAFGGTVYWGDGRPFHLEPWESILFESLDGSIPLGELRDDLIPTFGIDHATASGVVEQLVGKLLHAGAAEGVVRTSTHAAADESSAAPGELGVPVEISDPDTGSVILRTTTRSPEGNLVVEDRLPDGKRRITTSVTVSASAFGIGGSEDDRSPAELVPPDSCLGQKLRLAEPADRICVRHGGHRGVVRCDEPVISEMLRSRLPGVPDADPELSGATEVFVVKPFEGIGPPRVFDRFGQRRGRPRTNSEVSDLVAELLAEQIGSIEGCEPGTVRTRARAIHSDAGCVLVPANFEAAGWKARTGLRRRGLELSATDVVVDRSRICSIPSVGGTPRCLGPLTGIPLVGSVGTSADRRGLVTELVTPAPGPGRREILERTVDVVGEARIIAVPTTADDRDVDVVETILDRVAEVLGQPDRSSGSEAIHS